MVVGSCWGLAGHCPQALWGQRPCLGQWGVPEHVALLSAPLTLSLSLCLSLSLSRSCRRHFCDLQLVIWLQLHSHKSDRWQPCLLHGACREPHRRLAPSFTPHWTRAAPLGVLPLLPSPGWAPEEPGSSPCPGPFRLMVLIPCPAPLGRQEEPCAGPPGPHHGAPTAPPQPGTATGT